MTTKRIGTLTAPNRTGSVSDRPLLRPVPIPGRSLTLGVLLGAVGTVILTLAIAPGALAGDFAIDWYTIDGGGAMSSSGGNFELAATIGQHDASTTVMTGGSFELTGGFWQVFADPCAAFVCGDGRAARLGDGERSEGCAFFE